MGRTGSVYSNMKEELIGFSGVVSKIIRYEREIVIIFNVNYVRYIIVVFWDICRYLLLKFWKIFWERLI